jgi:oxalate decarboxylase
MPHYIENTGTTTMRFLEVFKSPKFEDVPLAQWLAFTPVIPHNLVRDSRLIEGPPSSGGALRITGF